MKRAFLLLVTVLTTLGATHAQNIVLGERVPELKNVIWLETNHPAITDLSCIVFFHTTNKGCIDALDDLKDLSDKSDFNLRIIIVSQENAAIIAPILSPYLSERFSVALDLDKKVFSSFGVEFVPFGVLTDDKNRALWMGNPQALTSSLILKINK